MATLETDASARWGRVMELNAKEPGDPEVYGHRLSLHLAQWRTLAGGSLVGECDPDWRRICTPHQLSGALVSILEDSDRWSVYPSSQREAAIVEVCQGLSLTRESFRTIQTWWSQGGALVTAG